MRYAVYDENGNIHKIVICSPSAIVANTPDGLSYCEMPQGDDSTHKVVNGEVVEK